MTLESFAELAWRQTFPNATDEAPITLEEFIETAKGEYAYQAWLFHINEMNENGYWSVPADLLSESDPLPVVDNYVDLKGLKIYKSLLHDAWLQNVGGLTCSCEYVKRSINQHQLLCEDDSLDDDTLPFVPIGDRLWFPNGTHKKELTIIFAKQSTDLDGDMEVDDRIGSIVRTRLYEIYNAKPVQPDETNNSNGAS